jgi:hypothetical protein
MRDISDLTAPSEDRHQSSWGLSISVSFLARMSQIGDWSGWYFTLFLVLDRFTIIGNIALN